MATQAGKTETEEKIAAYLDFSAQLIRRLDSRNINAVTLKELAALTERTCPRPPTAKAMDFDRLGTQIWNAAIHLSDQSSPMLKTWPQLEPQLRVLAFFLLDAAQRCYVKHGNKKSSQNLVRVFKTAMKAARICINANALDLCTRLFEKVADHVEHKQDPPPEHKKDKQESEADEMLKELTADYYLLRATASWKQDKPDSVTFWLARVLLLPNRADLLRLAEKKVDLTYEVGKAALKKKQFDIAARWLEQSYSIFDDVDQEMLSSDFCDLRLVVTLDFARALVGVGDAASLNKASNLIVLLDQTPTYAKKEHGYKTEVYLLRLDAIYAQEPFEADEFHGVLTRIIRTAILSEGTFRSIMYQIQKLNTYHPAKEGSLNRANIVNSNPGPHSYMACQSLDLLLSRLLPELPAALNMVEKIIVTRIWISSLSLQVHDHPSRLEALFEDIANTSATKLGLEATHASQSLIWKAVTSLQQVKNELEAARWCALANHAIFASSGEMNKSKLLRKMMTVAIAKGDAAYAREAYYQMSEVGKASVMTRYLMFKIALQEGDAQLAEESLEGVLKASSKETEKYLFACALEAQQTGDKRQFLATMNKVLEYHERNPSSDVRLPVLLRCIAGAITAELNTNDMPLEAGLTELCKVFEAAMRHGSNFKDGNDSDSRLAELRWFSCHSYNTALKYCSDMHPELLMRFMTASVSLIDLLRNEGEKDDGLISRLLLCRFLATSSLIVLARSEDHIERALQLYMDARRQIEAFHHKYQEAIQRNLLQPDAISDVEIKEFEMIQFDLEALMRLEQWDDLDKTLTMCLDARHSDRLERAADLILHIHTYIANSCHTNQRHQEKIPTVMEKIINTCWRNNKDITRLARWIRCLFQMTITTDPVMSLRCLDQAHAIANKAAMQQIPEPYPVEELEWLATTAFNHAVDLWFASVDEGDGQDTAKAWAEKALMLSGAVTIAEGALRKTLQDKWMRLRGMGQQS
ncbi:hypothetical protein D6C89_04743 [Aureobasidium pullulans]|nr:hypothetical protein D6C89_04743 [Aureobasidium pullulans]